MTRIRIEDLLDLRAYEREREATRARVIELKRPRRIALGEFVSVVLENESTVRFQVQEMLRAERILDDAAVQAELDIYDPLVPGPGELSMTLFLELTTPEQLRTWLPRLVGIERSVLLRIGEGADLDEIRDEVDPDHEAQLTRAETTASVHYVRIRLTPAQQRRFVTERVALALDHPAYETETVLAPATKASILADWGAAPD